MTKFVIQSSDGLDSCDGQWGTHSSMEDAAAEIRARAKELGLVEVPYDKTTHSQWFASIFPEPDIGPSVTMYFEAKLMDNGPVTYLQLRITDRAHDALIESGNEVDEASCIAGNRYNVTLVRPPKGVLPVAINNYPVEPSITWALRMEDDPMFENEIHGASAVEIRRFSPCPKCGSAIYDSCELREECVCIEGHRCRVACDGKTLELVE